MSSLILIRGLPGSGKSTLAMSICDSDLKNKMHLEADMFFYDDRTRSKYNFNHELLYKAHRWCQRETDKFLTNVDVIVSNTFTTKKELRPYFTIAKKYGIIPIVIHCQNDFGSVHNVPKETIEKMRKRFEYDISDLFEEIK